MIDVLDNPRFARLYLEAVRYPKSHVRALITRDDRRIMVLKQLNPPYPPLQSPQHLSSLLADTINPNDTADRRLRKALFRLPGLLARCDPDIP